MKTVRPTVRRSAPGGFTLTELLVGMAVGTVALAAVAVTSVSLQRSFEAANYQMTAQNDQLRVLDYLSRDLHTASQVSVADGGGRISATVPTAGASLLQLNLGPLLGSLSLGPASGATTQTVSYYVEGGQFIRDAGGSQTVLADTVADVAFTRAGLFVEASIQFTPRFSTSVTVAAQGSTRTVSRVFLRNASTAR